MTSKKVYIIHSGGMNQKNSNNINLSPQCCPFECAGFSFSLGGIINGKE